MPINCPAMPGTASRSVEGSSAPLLRRLTQFTRFVAQKGDVTVRFRLIGSVEHRDGRHEQRRNAHAQADGEKPVGERIPAQRGGGPIEQAAERLKNFISFLHKKFPI